MARNNTSKKSKKKNNNNSRPVQEQLVEDASLRLKFFIEDLRHDPMFRHRLFYPVIYKEIVRSNPHVIDNKVKQSVLDVIYEYYLLKMEKYSENDTAKIFQAILYANGPMLPENERFYFRDAGDPRSILNPGNMNTVIMRTDIFLKVLQDENLFNFVFTTTVGSNLETMRQRFGDLCNNQRNKNVSIDMLHERIRNNFDSKIRVDAHGIRREQGNLDIIRQYFHNTSIAEISKTVNFLVYMGNPRNIVTDFSYRPMDQSMLENYLEYGMDENQTMRMEYLNQLEQALDAQILQKDLLDQLDIFIPMLLKEYVSVCTGSAKDFCVKNPKTYSKIFEKDIRYEIRNNIKNKLQRSLKQILDYTQNYLTRKLLDSDHVDKRLFILRVLNEFFNGLQNRMNVMQLSQRFITYPNFVSSPDDDLANLIKEIFKNDIAYVYELCHSSDACAVTQNAFNSSWNTTTTRSVKDTVASLKHSLTSKWDFTTAIKCLEDGADRARITVLDTLNNIKIIPDSIKPYMDDVKNKIDSEYTKLLTSRNLNFAESVAMKIINVVKKTAGKPLDKLISDFKSKFKITAGELKSLNKLNNGDKVLLNYALNLQYKLLYLEKSINSAVDLINATDKYDDIKSAIAFLKNLKSIFNDIRNLIADIKENYKYVKDPDTLNLAKRLIENNEKCLDSLEKMIISIPDPVPDAEEYYVVVAAAGSSTPPRELYIDATASYMLQLYFKYYLKPVLVNFFGYAFDNFKYTARQNDINADIVSKDKLHFSKLLTPRTVGLFTIDGAVIQDIAKFTYILTSDTYSGVSYNSPDEVMKFLDSVYGIKYFNVIIYGQNDAYLYLNNIGTPYLYRGARTKIPIRELQRNYDFLMDPTRGLYQNIKIPRKK